MRTVTGILCAVFIAAGLALSAGVAQASEDEGTIAQVNVEAQTITLDNGNTYKLPGEFAAEALSEGTEVVIAYETVDGQNQITDIVTYE